MQMTSPPLRDLEPIPAVWDLLEGMENPQRDGLTGHGLSDTIKSALNPFDQIGNSKVQTVDGLNFEGVGVSARWPTPEANGAVGSTEYVQAVNAPDDLGPEEGNGKQHQRHDRKYHGRRGEQELCRHGC